MDSNQNQLIPSWTYEDFMSEAPYQWLFSQKADKFLLQRMIEAAKRQAKEVKFAGFVKLWNSYVQSNSAKATILGEADTMFPGQPVQLRCGSYTCDETGVHRYSELTGEVEVISHPIMPVKRVTNIETYEEKLELAYKRGKDGWKDFTVSRKTLASAQKILELSGLGVGVNSENAKEVVKFLSDLESRNYDDLPRQKSVGHMGWLPDGRFMPYIDDVSYDGESVEFLKIYNELKPTGSRDEWMKIASEVRNGESVPARIALATGFTGPLVGKFDVLPFVVHLWGETGCGKTVAQMLAASIYGNPRTGGLVKTLNGTKTSMELFAAFCCNIPIFLDELQTINDNRKNFDEIIYMLTEGAGKGRGTKEGGMQLQRRWQTCVMTTGETPIIQSNSGGGSAVRTIEVNYKFQPLFGTKKHAGEVAEILKRNYGWVGREFTDALQREEFVRILKSTQEKYFSDLMRDTEEKQAISASIILCADRLATAAIFHDDRQLKPDDIREFLVSKVDSDVNLRIYNWLINTIGTNPRRFDTEDQQNGELWGMIDEGENRVYIIRSVFDRLLKNEGYSPGAFLTWANQKGLLKREETPGNMRLTTRKRFNGVQTACVGLKLDRNGEYTEVQDEDLPF